MLRAKANLPFPWRKQEKGLLFSSEKTDTVGLGSLTLTLTPTVILRRPEIQPYFVKREDFAREILDAGFCTRHSITFLRIRNVASKIVTVA